MGCASFLEAPILNPDLAYQRDIKMDIYTYNKGEFIDPITIEGMGIIPKSKFYKVRVYPPGKVDMMTLVSCHRHKKTPRPKKTGGWFKKGYYEFIVPMLGSVDEEELCSFDVGAYEEKRGRHAWGTVAIKDDKFQLKAFTKCNGDVTSYDGVSVCQAKAGLIQEYNFDRLVSYAHSTGCALANLDTAEPYARKWKFKMPRGECNIYFMDIQAPTRLVHQAFFFGFDTIPIRGL
jgi:hypothetical protein